MSVSLQLESQHSISHAPSPLRASHSLADSPLFGWDRIRRLARDLPAGSMQMHRGDVEFGADPVAGQLPASDPVVAIDALAEERISVCFAGVDFDPEFQELLFRCLDEVGPALDLYRPDIVEPRAYLLLSSPHSVHPYHLDSNHNLLLHVRGSKTLHIWNPEDRKVLTEEELDHTFAVTQRLRFRADHLGRASINVLRPGHGVFLRSLSPHAVQNGSEVSVTLSVAFNTPWSIQRQVLHRINGNIRRLGLTPTPVGARPNLDRIKYATFCGVRGVKHTVHR